MVIFKFIKIILNFKMKYQIKFEFFIKIIKFFNGLNINKLMIEIILNFLFANFLYFLKFILKISYLK